MGAATITQMTLGNGLPMPVRNDVGGADKWVILQITPAAAAGGGYAANGDTIDLRPYFPAVCYGAELLSGIDAPTTGIKWEINVNPAAAVTATSTRITAFQTLDPSDTSIQNEEFVEIAAATDLSAFPTTWRFRGR